MIIRADIRDITALVKLLNSAYRGDESKKGWTTEADLLDGERTNEKAMEQLINNPDSFFLKYTSENNELLGCVFLEKRSDKFYLGMFAVSPLYQAKGIGKKLLEAAEKFCVKQNVHKIEMTVISVRHELIPWYERHGYAKTGELRPFPANDQSKSGEPFELVVLEKQLES